MSKDLQKFVPQAIGKGFTFYGKVSPTGWEPDGDLSYEQWEQDGQIFQRLDGSLNWIIGDWLNYGERKYGEMYAQAIEWTGNKLQHLKDIKWVASSVKTSSRDDVLSFTHHRYVAHLPDAEQREWLTAAATNEWSSRELLQALESANAKRKPLPQPQWTKEEEEEEIPFTDLPEEEDPPYTSNYMYSDDEILARAQEIREERSRERREERIERIQEIVANNRELNNSLGVFPIIYADPPWRYEHSVSDSRMIENHYPTMSLREICALPVSEIATHDAVLFLWATSPKLSEAMEVIAAWGFSYRSCIVWDKERIGMGYYVRQQHELLLIATRGELPTPEPANRPASVLRVRRSEEHSEKPEEFYRLIESMYPEHSRIELFARGGRMGWAAWGNQA